DASRRMAGGSICGLMVRDGAPEHASALRERASSPRGTPTNQSILPARHAKLDCFVACAFRHDEANVTQNKTSETIDAPYRRWRLPARDQYLRADEGELRRLRAWRRLAGDGSGCGRAQGHAQ